MGYPIALAPGLLLKAEGVKLNFIKKNKGLITMFLENWIICVKKYDFSFGYKYINVLATRLWYNLVRN
jgi:hypothetical protein